MKIFHFLEVNENSSSVKKKRKYVYHTSIVVILMYVLVHVRVHALLTRVPSFAVPFPENETTLVNRRSSRFYSEINSKRMKIHV